MMKSVFVDMGDTLVKFVPRMHEKMAEVMRKEGLEVTDYQVFRALVKHMGKSNFPHPDHDGLSALDFTDILYEMGIPPTPELVRRLASVNYLSDHYELYDDSIPFLRELKGRGVKIILVTNTTKKVRRIVRDLDLDKYVDHVVASCDVNLMKPHPKIFYHASLLAEGPAVHIGDVYEIDYIGARRAYLNAILLDRFNFYPEIKRDKVNNLYEALKLIDEKLKY
jgi:2-haloacid dehalogenase/putative hydrolase of the HAD superfamily